MPVALALLIAACAPGKEPPQSTEMVPIVGKQVIVLGAGQDGLVCEGDSRPSDLPACDEGDPKQSVQTWLDELSFVPTATVSVGDFQMDRHEVTNVQYLYCVESGACSPPAQDMVEGVRYYGNPKYDSYPVVWVTWEQARDYCKFVNRALPTEAQWAWAARGPAAALGTYPWAGKEPASCKVSQRFVSYREAGAASGDGRCGDFPSPVASTPADNNQNSLHDLASNVAEIVRDDWDRYALCDKGALFPQSCQEQGESCKACQDAEMVSTGACAKSCKPDQFVICKSAQSGDPASIGQGSSGQAAAPTDWVIRGGSFNESRCHQRLFVRRRASGAADNIGFRCSL